MYVFGVSWDDSKKPRLIAGLVACALLFAVAVTPRANAAPDSSGSNLVSVIVRQAPATESAARDAVKRLGGRLGARLDVINGFSARVPRSALDDLRSTAGVLSVTPDARVELHQTAEGYDQSRPGSLYRVAKAIDADDMWFRGYIGAGVDIALIDSGVVPVDGLTRPGKIINGPDLSFESQDDKLRYLDTFGHGTHMAGIMAGLDSNLPTSRDLDDWRGVFGGIAPGSRVVSIKVADALGNTDVSQVIAAIDWVVEHRFDNGMNIRVLNLSFGTDGVQPAALDPLSYAAEVAWRKGIVTVVAAGNRGYGSPRLNNPAYNPFVIAVGSVDHNGTEDTRDDDVSDFSSRGTLGRSVDVLAPGRSIVSLRNPGSFVDVNFPSARVGTRFFKGSGTSQSAAVVSGAAALLIDQRPNLSPDQVKKLLMSTARSLPRGNLLGQGEGLIDLSEARRAATPLGVQTHAPGTGLGTLEGARGSLHLYTDGRRLDGERDIFGTRWDPSSWTSRALNLKSWVGGLWNDTAWTDGAWTGTSWAGPAWGSILWSKNSWSGGGWSRNSWSKNSWSGDGWTGDAWSRNSWSGEDWAKNSWSGGGWLGDYWAGDLAETTKNSWSGADSAATTGSFGFGQVFKNSWSSSEWSDAGDLAQTMKNSWSAADSAALGDLAQTMKNSWSSNDSAALGGLEETLKNSWSGVDAPALRLGDFGIVPLKNSWSSSAWE